MKDRINIVLFWFGNHFGKYGRTYEKVAEHLSYLPEVGHVVCTFPPLRIQKQKHRFPIQVKRISRNLRILRENSYVVAQNKAPYRLRTWINKVASETILRLFIRALGFKRENTILWLFPPHPYLEDLISKVPHQLVVTQVVDNFTYFDSDSWLHGHAAEQYPRLQEFSDLIIVASKLNQEIFRLSGVECHHFDNAVDKAFLGTPSQLPYLIHGHSPRLGYVGWITERTDLELVRYVANMKPDCSIILVGPQDGNKINGTGLEKMPNVQYLGEIPNREVPDFLKTLDICLIPHKDTPYSRSMSPLKLYQYLASGRPIVSTNITGLDRLKQHVSVANSYEEFVELIEQVLKIDTIELSRSRIEAAKNETWDKRIRHMFDVVKKRFNEKRAQR